MSKKLGLLMSTYAILSEFGETLLSFQIKKKLEENIKQSFRSGIKGLVCFMFVLTTALLAKEKPNFVIVLADDVSWSSFGCVDSGLYTHTPNIDKLAEQGLRFANFSCAVAQCAPARHELYTGLLPPTSGVHANGTKAKGDFKSIINYLGDLDYNVGLTGKNHFKNKSKFQIVPGFDSDGNSDNPKWEMSGVKSFINESLNEKKPFCMVIASVHAHHPWTVGKAKHFPTQKMVVPPHMVDTPLTREALSRHAAEVEDLDHQVGATMKMLDDMKLRNNTVLIFLSEQGTALPKGKWSIYDFGTRAVCLVRWPGKIKEGSVTDAVAMYCDVVPTLVEMAGGKPPAIDGRSFLPVLKGESSDHRDHAYLVHQYGGYTQRAIRTKEYKLIWTPQQEQDYYLDVMMDPQSKKFFGLTWKEWLSTAKSDVDAQAKIDSVVKHPEFELYDIKKDPWEMNNLASLASYGMIVEDMHTALKEEMKKLNDSFSTQDPKAEKRERKGKGKKRKKRRGEEDEA